MFSDATKRGVHENSSAGLWAVHISTPQFWTWKKWLGDQLGYNRAIHSNWLTTYSEWPPATAAAASRITQAVSDMRDELRISKPVPRRVMPWDGVIETVPHEFRAVAP